MTATALKMPERTHCLTRWIILRYTGANSLGDFFLGTLLRSCQLVMELSKKIGWRRILVIMNVRSSFFTRRFVCQNG
jgi:hypothetical protein